MLPPPRNRHKGFTLAELLISLAILGVIATFVIPKIIVNSQNSTYNSAVLEAAGTVSGAYQRYQSQNQITASFSIKDLTAYLNYIAVDTSSTVVSWQTSTTFTCSATAPCLKLHNGSSLQYWATIDSFGGTSTINAVPFLVDPDSKVTDGTTNGPGKAVALWLYADGHIGDYGNMRAGTTYTGGSSTSSLPSRIPPWFHWN